MVPLASLGEMVGLKPTLMKSLIVLASKINKTDYWKNGRTCEKLGIAGMSVKELNEFLETGEIHHLLEEKLVSSKRY